VITTTAPRLARLLAVCLALLLTSAAAFGQERFGEIHGTATDPTGAVLPNLTVTVTETSTNRVLTTKTTSDGTYVLRSVEPGTYRVRFELSGFGTQEIPNVQVTSGRVLTVNARMEVGTTEQSVQVTEAAPLIDTTTTLVGNAISDAEMLALPKTRSFQSMALTAPNVNQGNLEGGIQINGASGAENQYFVDGISTNSVIEGGSRQNAFIEILEEVQVKTAGIEAQYGGALGGVVSAITKSGGNDFHGDVHYYMSHDKLRAGPIKRLILDPRDALQRTATYQQDHKPEYSFHEPGYSLGGRIIRDKLFFFSSGSPQFINEKQTYNTSDNQTVVLPRESRYWQAYNKLSADPVSRIRANFGWLWSPSWERGQLARYTGLGNAVTSASSGILPFKDQGEFFPQSNLSGTVDFTLTPTTMLQLRGAYFYDNYKTTGVENLSAVIWGVPSIGIPGIPADLQHAANYSNRPTTDVTLYDLGTRMHLAANLSKFVNNFGGSHDIRLGFERVKNVNKVYTGTAGGGEVTLYWDQAYEDPASGELRRGRYGYYQVDVIGTIGSTGANLDSWYIQDRWRPIRKLSLDLGLRMEKEVIPSFNRSVKDYAFEFGWSQKIAPRLGASYDVFGDGRMKIYGSWGLFYDWVKYELARGTFGGDIWRTYYRALDSLDVFTLSGTNMPGADLWRGATPYEDHRVPSFSSDQIDPDIRPMSVDLTNAGVEYQLSPSSVFAVRYTRNNLREAIDDVGRLVGGNEIYTYGNPGRGIVSAWPPQFDRAAIPIHRPKRTYDALELNYNRRFSNRWFLGASYVLSRLYGNFAGLASSDELVPEGGRSWSSAQGGSAIGARPGTAASRYYDSPWVHYDASGNLVEGRLATDRPHVVKLYGSYTQPWGGRQNTQLGWFFYGGSGTPQTTRVLDTHYVEIAVNGRGDMGRGPFTNFTNLLLSHEINVAEGKTLRFEFDAQNVFNQKTAQTMFGSYNRWRVLASSINSDKFDPTKGFDYRAAIAETGDARGARGASDPRYGMETFFRTGFIGRLGIKFMF
jgi:hypothetical protein